MHPQHRSLLLSSCLVLAGWACSPDQTKLVHRPPVLAELTIPVLENVADGTVARTFTQEELGGRDVRLTRIVDGNDGEAFGIDDTGHSLVVVHSAVLDYETHPTFDLTLEVTDVQVSARGKIHVQLADVNEQPTASGGPFTIPARTANGTVIGTVAVVDADNGQQHAFIIFDGTGAGAFTIDAASGQIAVADSNALDFFATPTLTLNVRVTDGGTPPLSATTVVTINLTEVNEPPVASGGPFTVPENSVAGTVVGTMVATDPNGDPVTFAIDGGTGAASFVIDATTGVLTVAAGASLDFETLPDPTLVIKVSDNGGLSSTKQLTIALADVNEAPVLSGGPFMLAENSVMGAPVGSLTLADPDMGQGHTFTITGGTGAGVFDVDVSTGQITVVDSSALNFEVAQSFTLTVDVLDSGIPPLSGSVTLTIQLIDVNEAPIVTGGSFTIAENSAAGTTVGTVGMVDVDAGQSHTFAITGGTAASHFTIDAAGQISVATGSTLDFETMPSGTLELLVTDDGLPPLTGAATITVQLTNVNESPVLTGGPFVVVENSAVGTFVGTMNVTDEDVGQTHTFSITGGTGAGVFAIDATTGQITVLNNSTLHLATNSSFTFDVKVTDDGAPALSASRTVTINLSDTNDAPTLSGGPFTLVENSANGTTVGSLTVSDLDNGQTHTFSVTGGTGSNAFAIDASTGRITVANSSALDFETTPSFTLAVEVQDNGIPPLLDSLTVTITLTDVNEAPTLSGGPFILAENSANGTTVGTLSVSDPEAAQSHTFSITGGTGAGVFAVNASTGRITVSNSSALDFEATPSFTLDVKVTDNGTPALSDTRTVTINLTNANEAPTASGGPFSLAENSAVGTTVGTVSAADVDAGQGHTFSITGGTGASAFAINTATGQITVSNSSALDFETTPSFTLTVQVTDDGTPALSGTTTVTVNLTNVNEAPTVSGGPFSIAENSANGATVGTVTAGDPDAGDTRTFTITSGNPNGTFAISTAGKITVANGSALNFETQSSYTLVVRVADAGGLSATANVQVNVTDVNEAPTLSGGPFSIAENSANSTVVGTMTASDVDTGQSLTFSVTGGTGASAFAINASTGQITVSNTGALNFETTPSFTLTVKVMDNGTPTLSNTATITINLTDVNEAPTVSGGPFTVAENSANGTAVGTVTVSDPDAGQTSTFSITGGTGASAFAINASTGQITVATSSALDFETTPSFTLTVRATDNGTPALFGTATVTINLTNVNEAPTVSGGPFTIAENSANGTVVGTVSSSDVDAGQTRTFSITAGNTNSAFAINASTGQITVATSSALNFETTTSFALTVRATDNGTPALFGTATVTINLTDVNEAPTVSGGPFTIAENSANGTIVGTVTASDVDAGQTKTFSITAGNSSGAFAINASTGQVTVATSSALDFETTSSFSLTVQATDNGTPALSGTTTVTINLTNVNEAPTVSGGPFTIAENSANGTVVGTVTASDVDAGQTKTISITAGNTSGAFAINASTGQITVATSSALNYEVITSFSLTIQVTDNGSPALSGTTTVTINLTNVNEAPTVSGGPFTIAENSANGTVVGTVTASDPDSGQTKTFSITAGNTSGAFAINASTGQITVATSSVLNYEAATSYTLTVQVTDNGSPALSGTTTVTINITDVNEAPTVSGGPFTIAENSANGTVVGTVSASDPDSGQTKTISITAGNTSGAFAINASTGQITVATSSALNYEVITSFSLTIQVTDNGTPALSGTTTVTINLTNVNEAPTVSGGPFTIAENSANGTIVGTVTASDVDAGQTKTFSITAGNSSNAFAINASTGQITVATSSALDFETTSSFSLTVQATDNGTPALSGTATVTINLTDVNEAPTVSGGPFTIAEGSASGTAVGTVTASDPDSGQTKAISITGGNSSGAFAINASTGQITVATSSALNYETTPSFTLTVQATDNGSPALSGTTTVTINLTNVNEAPTISGGPFTVAENSANGTVVGTVTASDPDSGQTKTFSITAGNSSSAFAINASTGQITVATSSALNYEAATSYTLTVQVTDNGSPALSGTTTVTINITDVNEAPTVSGGPFTLAENSANGTAVGTMTASDPDAGQTKTFSITGGNTGGAFAINASTGQITVATSSVLNYETTPSFTLTVQVTDNGTPALSGTATVTINLTNVNEAPTASGGPFTVTEGSANGTMVGTVTGSDPDSGQTKTFSITGGTGASVFAINASSGLITVANSSALNYEVSTSFTLAVQVTDNGSPALSGTTTVTINVTDVNEKPTLSGGPFSIPENSPLGTVVGTVTVTDPDIGQTHLFAITAGSGASAFAVNASTGQITVADSSLLNYELMASLSLSIQVLDSGSPMAGDIATFTINLTDVNEAPVLSGGPFSIAENSANGTVVGTMSATDPDAGQTKTYSLTGGTGASAFAINASSGAITVANSSALDFETVPSFTLTLKVTDNGVPALSDTRTITVNLTDANEAPVLAGGPFSVTNTAPVGTVAGTVSVSDPDVGQSRTFTILNGNTGGKFAINASTGEITVATIGLAGVYSLSIQATDNGTPALSGTLTVGITVTNPISAVNDGPFQVIAKTSDQEELLANDTVGTPAATVASFGGGSLGGAVTSFPANGNPVPFAGGTIAIQSSGSVTIEPNTAGTYTFSYRLQNGVGSSDAQVTVQVCTNLDVGEVFVARPETLASVCVGNTTGAQAGYLLTPMNLTPATTYQLGIAIANNGAGTTTATSSTLETTPTSVAPSRDTIHSQIASYRASPGSSGGTAVSPAASIPHGVPAVGDKWILNPTLDKTCQNGFAQKTNVVAVGTHSILVTDYNDPNDGIADYDLPAGGFTQAQFDAFVSDFDTIIYPAVTGLYGEPADIDGNGRVVLYMTTALNRLSPPASSTVVTSFTNTRDLVSQSICPTSNVGEVIYLITPDPTGAINSNVRTVSFVDGGIRPGAAHELAHLINDSRRLSVNNAPGFEEAWLDEALAHMAEERIFFAASGLSPRSNIILSTITTGANSSTKVAAFNTYANQNYGRLRNWLQTPARAGITGNSLSLLTRGISYAYLRYLADQYSGTEVDFLHAAANSTSSGEANLTAAMGSDTRLWMRDFLISTFLDDAGIGSPLVQYTDKTWNYRSVYSGLGGFSLAFGGLGLNASTQLTLAGGGSAYFMRFNVDSSTLSTITLTPPAVSSPDAWYALIRSN